MHARFRVRPPRARLLAALATAWLASAQPPAARAEAPASEPPAPTDVVEVTVRTRSEADRLRRSAEAVSVVETKDARQQTADLGEVLARMQGIGVQRAGGLGSDTRFSLNGLTDDQIRFFLDGVPLELSGFPFGVANVPVNLIGRAEVYRGVVPIRFGADALGGAVNLVSEGSFAPKRAQVSLQLGSFGTERATASVQRLHEPSGLFTRINAFLDHADNDYPMTTDVADATGQIRKQRVYRFHDAYRAMGGNIETGFVDRKWADRLLLRVFIADYDRELQNSPLMTYVYGDVTRSELTSGATLRYEHTLGRLKVAALAGYTYDQINFRDLGTCVYDWFGRCVRARPQPGEILGRPQDEVYWTHSAYGRFNTDWELARGQSLRVSLAPSFTYRTGDERRQSSPNARDLLATQNDLYGLVSGIEYRLELFDERLTNVAFAKDYLQVLRADEILSTGVDREQSRSTHRGGLGDSLRYTFTSFLFGKLSYEWATRLPRTDEIFGTGFPITSNLELKPELSHNVNLELDATSPASRLGVFHGNVNGFVRKVSQLIVLVPERQTSSYKNVDGARSVGVEAAGDWTSPGRYLLLTGNTTYVDFRNTSREGQFAANKGVRIANRPYLFATGSARVQLPDLLTRRDELSLAWTTRYVHSFLRGWEGMGDPSTKLRVNAQVVHTLGLIYELRRAATSLTFTAEVQNLTDAEVYDLFGVPRAGRAFHFKMTAAL